MLHTLLQNEPRARERKNKNRAIAHVLKDKYQLDISLDRLESVVKAANTLDREWRKILEENPDLRGNDYGKKTLLEKNKQRELGYSV